MRRNAGEERLRGTLHQRPRLAYANSALDVFGKNDHAVADRDVVSNASNIMTRTSITTSPLKAFLSV
jgi:hypothetical protein